MRLFLFLGLIQHVLAAVLGIDYGAEFTKAVLVAPQVPFSIILSPDSKRKDASGLTINTRGDTFERVYGDSGLSLTSRFPQSSLFYIKGLLGVPLDSTEVRDFESIHPGLNLVSTKRNSVAVKVGDHEFPVEEIVAMNFKDIQRRAQEVLESAMKGASAIKSVAISVPAQFGMVQRRAVTDSASLAGLDLISLVNDGVAVATNFVSKRSFDKLTYFVVYDVGSESTSATLMSADSQNGTTVLSVEGYASLPVGGKTITHRVRDLILERFEQKSKVKKSQLTPRVLNRLWKEAERAKAVLSANSNVNVFIESLFNDIDFSTQISRQELEELCEDLISSVDEPLLNCLNTFEGVKVPISNVSSIVLAGGGTRVPFVQAQIRKTAGDIISKGVNADESAVLGTALRGVGISGIFKSRPMIVRDKSLHTYKLDDDVLFERGSPLDTSKSIKVSIPEDFDVSFSLYEDDAKISRWNVPQLKEAVQGLKDCSTDPELELRFGLSPSQIVELSDVVLRCVTEDVKPVTRYLPAKRVDATVSPLTRSDKEELTYDMKQLDKLDADRIRKQTLHNELESLLYKVRELDPENAVVNDMLEHLDDKSTLVQLSERLKKIESLYKELLPEPEPEPEPVDTFASDIISAFSSVGLIPEDVTAPDWAQKLLLSASADQIEQVRNILAPFAGNSPVYGQFIKGLNGMLEELQDQEAHDEL